MKKVLVLVLAAVMTLGIATTAVAAINPSANITGMSGSLMLGFSGDTHLGNVAPQDRHVVYIDLVDTMFTWENHTPDPGDPQPLTAAQIRRARLDVRTNNNRVLEGATVNANQSRIEVRFQRELVGTRDIDFDFDVTLSVNGRQMRDYLIRFSGTFANPVVEVWANTEREDISFGEVAYAQESIRSITFDVGEGVSVITRMHSVNRLYAVATLAPDSRDEAFFNTHREVSGVVNLRSVGIPTGATVRLGANFRGYYVYSDDGTFLGRGTDELPLHSKYYLATARLAATNEPTPPEPDVPDPDTGTDNNAGQPTQTTPPSGGNVNLNPPTGR